MVDEKGDGEALVDEGCDFGKVTRRDGEAVEDLEESSKSHVLKREMGDLH